MNMACNDAGDIALLAFLDQLKNDLRAVREDLKAIRLALRRACEHFQVNDGCIAVTTPDRSRVELLSVMPRDGRWDLSCLSDFIGSSPKSVIAAGAL